MERLIEYLLFHFKLENSIAPVLALIIAVMDNKSKGVKDCIIVSILATGVAGVVQDYLPAHSIWISIRCVIWLRKSVFFRNSFRKISVCPCFSASICLS